MTEPGLGGGPAAGADRSVGSAHREQPRLVVRRPDEHDDADERPREPEAEPGDRQAEQHPGRRERPAARRSAGRPPGAGRARRAAPRPRRGPARGRARPPPATPRSAAISATAQTDLARQRRRRGDRAAAPGLVAPPAPSSRSSRRPGDDRDDRNRQRLEQVARPVRRHRLGEDAGADERPQPAAHERGHARDPRAGMEPRVDGAADEVDPAPPADVGKLEDRDAPPPRSGRARRAGTAAGAGRPMAGDRGRRSPAAGLAHPPQPRRRAAAPRRAAPGRSAADRG